MTQASPIFRPRARSGAHPDPAKPVRAPTTALSALPGPRPWPLIGNAMQIDLQRYHATLERWAEQFGPLYVFRFWRRPILVVTRPDLIQQILHERPHGFRRLSAIQSVFSEMGVASMFAAEGGDWHRQRRIVMQGFNVAQLKRFFPTLVTITERLRRRWARAAASGLEIDVPNDFMRYTLDVTTSLAFGHDINTLEKDGDTIQHHLQQIIPTINRRIRAPVPYWHLIKLPADRALDHALVAVRTLVHDLVRRRGGGSVAKPANFLDAMLAARQGKDNALSDEEVFGNVFTILLAGEDTTAYTMAWIVHFMLEHPEVAARLRAEADAVLGAKRVVERLEDIDRLSYLDAVAAEAMRLKPVAPVMHLEANEDTELGGVHVTRGTTIALLMRAAAVDERHFAHARDFRPERWVADANTIAAHDTRAFTPFGGGPRFCPGRNLALLEIKTAIAMIAGHFNLLRPMGAPPVKERFAVTMMPTDLRVGLKAREPAAVAL